MVFSLKQFKIKGVFGEVERGDSGKLLRSWKGYVDIENRKFLSVAVFDV